MRYRKRDIFRDPDGRIEAVERGSQHDLLITSSGIFTFGICLDFCNLVGRSPYERLDVDFVLVASCGNDATMGGHIDRSRSLLINRRTRVFIVQQSDTDRQDDMIGYILNPTGSAKSIVLSETLTGEPWNIYEAQAFIED